MDPVALEKAFELYPEVRLIMLSYFPFPSSRSDREDSYHIALLRSHFAPGKDPASSFVQSITVGSSLHT